MGELTLIDLGNKAALVTGGSRGIGAATARLLAQAGASVALTYKNREKDAQEVLESLEKGSGTSHVLIQADLARADDCERAVDAATKAFGRLDILVANAGIWPPAAVPLKEMDPSRWHETLKVNLDSVFYCCRAALNVMNNGSSIVIVSSTAAQRGEAFHADYAASKGAIVSLVKSLAVEAAPDVTVNSVAPGWVDTEMSEKPYGRESGAGRREIEATIPLGRVAQPQDIAGPIVFLCSPLARHITGEVLNVNGGSVLCG